jgi:hypothetical protein
MMVLALTGWFRRAPEGFSMHRRTSYLAVMGVFCFLIVVESGAAHLVLASFSATAAWVATGLSLYTLLWMIGDAHAVRLSPLRLTPEGLLIERGRRWRVLVPWADLAEATPIESRVDGALDLSLLGPNVLLTLRTPALARGPLGITRSAARLTLSIDDRDAFLARVKAP